MFVFTMSVFKDSFLSFSTEMRNSINNLAFISPLRKLTISLNKSCKYIQCKPLKLFLLGKNAFHRIWQYLQFLFLFFHFSISFSMWLHIIVCLIFQK